MKTLPFLLWYMLVKLFQHFNYVFSLVVISEQNTYWNLIVYEYYNVVVYLVYTYIIQRCNNVILTNNNSSHKNDQVCLYRITVSRCRQDSICAVYF